jgi:ApeA N-terminal domain 1
LIFNSKEGGKLTLYGPIESFAISDMNLPHLKETKQSAEKSNVCEREQEKILILGKSDHIEKLTLLSTPSSEERSAMRENYNFTEREFKIDFIFTDIHFEKIEDIVFESILVEYSNSCKWLTDNNLIGYIASYPHKTEPKHIIEHFYGKPIDIKIGNRCLITILSYPTIKKDFISKETINYHTYVRITSLGIKKLEDYISLNNIFQHFLNFVIADEVRTLRIVGNVKVRINNHHVIVQSQICYHSSISQAMDKLNLVTPFLPIDKGVNKRSDKFIEIINHWFGLRNKIPAVYDLYFGVMYNSELYLSNKFLMLAEAISIYGDKIVSENRSDPALQQKMKRIDTICQAIDQSLLETADKDWVKDIMKDKRSLSYKEKIITIYEIYEVLLSKLSTVIGSKGEFSEKVKKYRNELTHGNIDYDQLNNQDLLWKYRDLQLILQLCILSELGFSINEIKDIYHINN